MKRLLVLLSIFLLPAMALAGPAEVNQIKVAGYTFNTAAQAVMTDHKAVFFIEPDQQILKQIHQGRLSDASMQGDMLLKTSVPAGHPKVKVEANNTIYYCIPSYIDGLIEFECPIQ